MKKYTSIGLSVVGAMLVAWSPAIAQDVDAVTAVEQQHNAQMQQNQNTVDNVSDQTDDIVQQYKVLLEENRVLRTYNSQVRDQIAQQESDIVLITTQIDGITQTRREVMPLIQDMVDSLRDFVNADIPFRKETRLDRVEALQDLMDQPDVPPSERYRLVMERFKTEAEYGQTVNAYADTEVIGGTEMKLNFVNIGRVAFMAQNIAGDRSFVWDNQAREWVELDSSFNSAVQDVILMAEKAQQPEMVIVPVFANQGAE